MPRRRSRPEALFSSLTLATAIAACVSPTGPSGPETTPRSSYRADGILFTAASRLADTGSRSLEVTLHAMNETDFWAETGILGGPCMLRPRLYRIEDGAVSWSAFDLHDACPEPLRLIRLDGGDEEHIPEAFEAPVPPGAYRVTLTIEHAGQLVELVAGEIVMP
jgi:hypothetical protein